MKVLKYILLLIVLIPMQVSAQFYITGDDPGKLKWSYIESDNFRIIYPTGADSLARIYGTDLEKYRTPLSRTSGYLASGGFGKKMPVVMHAYNGANGSVAWAPKRMDLFTLPTPYDPDPIPWNKELAIHEGRHVTQMQFGMTKAMKPGNWIFGEMWNIAVTLLYPRIMFMEGDAVIAETAFTPSGRGRRADFLNYYRVAFEQGYYKTWAQWLCPSQKNYSPTYYALGYMGLGGMRYLYDCPYLMYKGMDMAARRPYNLEAFNSTIKKETGLRFKDAFTQVCDTLTKIWKSDSDSRAPFIPSEPVSAEPELYTDYHSGVFVGSDLYLVKSGHLTAPVLVKIDPFKSETTLGRFASNRSTLKTDNEGRIYWTEESVNPRWVLKSESRLRYITCEEYKIRRHRIGKKGRIYNPTPCADGENIAIVEYSVKGGSALRIISSGSKGETLGLWNAPDSIQLVESAWIKDNIIYCTGISNNGYGIYSLNTVTGEWNSVLGPEPVMIKDFKNHGDDLMFTCDRTGVNELYHLNPETGELTQKTSTHFGAEDFVYSPEDYYLYYTSQTLKGKQVFRTQVDSLINRPANISDRYKYPIAEKITAQEKELARQRKEAFIPDSTIQFTEPAKYKKFPHAFNIHSWAPVYVSADNIMKMSYDKIYDAISLGITGIMQNRLATGVGEIGYSAHKDPYDPTKWRHSGHLKYTYSGWYPVFEIKLDYNDRSARQFNTTGYLYENNSWVSMGSKTLDTPYFQGNISTYIPFNFSSGGWHRGFIPKLSYTITNDMFNSSMTIMSYDPEMGAVQGNPTFVAATEGSNSIRQYLSGSIRAYSVLGTPNSAVYPKWGIGVEAGATGSIGLSRFLSPMGYLYGYGYIPGLVPQQGFKLSVMYQRKLREDAYFGQATVSVVPRGLANNSELMSYLSIYYDNLTKFSADYAIPIFVGDIGIGGYFLYLKRLVLTPHFDFNIVEDKPYFFSAGATLAFDLESICFITWPCSIGVTYSYNGDFNGEFNELRSNNISFGRHFVGPVFSVTF